MAGILGLILCDIIASDLSGEMKCTHGKFADDDRLGRCGEYTGGTSAGWRKGLAGTSQILTNGNIASLSWDGISVHVMSWETE